MAEKKFFVDINLQGSDINNLRADTLDITTNLASANTKRIVYWSGQYYYSDGTDWHVLGVTGSAGGDLTGTYPNPTVDGLQGNPVSNATPTSGQTLQWNGSEWVPGAIPNGGSGGGGIVYYLNYQNTTDISPTTGLPTSPVAVSQLGITYNVGTGSVTSANLTNGSYSLVCGFVTIVGTPGVTDIPAGLWDFNIWASVTGSGGSTNQTQFQIRIYKYNSSTGVYTSLANSDDVYIYDPVTTAQYIANVTMPQTTILSTERIYIELWAQKNVTQSRQVVFYFDSLHPSHVHTTIPSVAGTGIVKVVNGVFQSPASTIVDSDVSATAAISVSKLSMATSKILGRITTGTGSVEEITVAAALGYTPIGGSGTTNYIPKFTNSGTLGDSVIYNTGANTGIGVTSPISPFHVSSVDKVISNTLYTSDYITLSAEETAPGFNIISAGSSVGNRGVFKATRSRGTLDIPTAVINGDNTFSLVGAGHDGTTNLTTAGISFFVDAAVSTNTVPQAISFATGPGSSRIERMRISSSGNVGIGTTNPTAALSVRSTAVPSAGENLATFTVTDSTATLGIQNASNSDGIFLPSLVANQAIGVNQTALNLTGYINSADDTGTNPIMTFRSALNSFTGATTRPLFDFRNWSTSIMTIAASGNVGVGITAPTAKLHVNNTTASNSLLIEDEANPDSSPFVINNSGRVGIGILSPSYKLHVTNSQGGVGGFSESFSGSVNSIGFQAQATSDGVSTPAINIGGKFIAVDATNNYALELIDGSEIFAGTFLKNIIDGKANWANITVADTGLTLTTTGTSGVATLVGNTLNIPTYESSLIPKMSGNEIWRGSTFRNNSTTIDTTAGVTLSTSGTNTARSVGTTSYATRGIRLGVTASVVATGRYSGMRGSALLWYVTGGFLYTGEFNISDTAFATGTHNFWGLASSTSDLVIGDVANNQPSALTNIIAFANDSGDANLQIMYNDATGTATKTDLGSSFPANRTAGVAITTVYSCYLYNAPASSNVIYRIVNKETGAVAQGTLSTNLPASTVGLNFFGVRTMGTAGGGVTNAGQFDVYRLGVYSL